MPKIVYSCKSCGKKGKPKSANDEWIELAKSVGICGMPTDVCECGTDLFMKGFDVYQLHDNGELELLRPPVNEIERIVRRTNQHLDVTKKLLNSYDYENPKHVENIVYFMQGLCRSLTKSSDSISDINEGV